MKSRRQLNVLTVVVLSYPGIAARVLMAQCGASGHGSLGSAWDPAPPAPVMAPSPTGFSLRERLPGTNGIPTIDFDRPGLNAIGTAGPVVSGSVNGTGGGGSVFLGTGAAYVDQVDFYLPLNGIDWLHQRKYSSTNTPSQTWAGSGWWCNEMLLLTVSGSEGASNVTVQFDPHYTLNFTFSGGSWTCDDKYLNTLTFTSGSDEYTVTRIDGFKYVFHDSQVANNPGRLKRIEDAYGNDQAFTYSSGQLTDIVVDVVDGNDHKITYTYFTSGDNNGLLQYVKVYKSTTTTSANLIGQVEYVYHSATADDYGLEDDLMKAIISRKGTTDGDGTLSITGSYYYRYYKGTWNKSTNPGTDHQLRYVLFPENADRLGSPETQSNANFASYANVLYYYGSGTGRVSYTQERLPGTSCGCGGGALTETTYAWTLNTGTPDLDTWYMHCTADRSDSGTSRVTVDLNRRYNILTWVVQNTKTTPTIIDIWHFDYGTSGDTEGRMTYAYNPSACSAYSTSTYAVTLNSGAGLVHKIEYDTGTYARYPKKIRVQQGTGGTPDTLIQYARTITERPDLVTTATNYESGSEADGRNTTLAYTFYDSGGAKVQPSEIDVTHPSVSAAKNGPDASAVTKQFFDKRTGALRWTLDGEGYVNFYAYDDATGANDLSVVDANTSTLLTVLDDNWDGVAHGGLGADDTVPFSRTGTGTALDIDSSSTIDWLGRARKTTDAGGLITYMVYKDDETRAYPAWNTSTYVTLLPFQITLTDKDGRPEDQITIKTGVTPTKDGSNEPTGAETYTNADMASRTLTTYNLSGMVDYVDRYHSMPSSGNGTRYTHFYRSAREYDSMGRVEYTIEDVADESTYDREQVTRHYYDFLGRTTKIEEGVSDNTHDISASKPTLVKTVEYFYDDPDTDSTPENGAGDGRLSWMKKWFGSGGSDYNNTEYRYDYRNRRCLTIPPTSPYSLVKYDNLNRVTASASYSATTNLDPGDDPATTENGNRLSLSKTYFDEWGRVYKTETYDDPGDATPEDELASHTYFDRRGLEWASDPANSGISYTKYDGAGRQIQSMLGTQFDAAKYTSSAPDYPDDNEGLFQVTEYTLDDEGQTQKIITKELNHNDTAGIDLTNNNDYIRTYVYHWYDAAHRLTDTCNYGTNHSDGWKDNSTAPSYGGSAPARSDTALVTTYSYNSEGHQWRVTDSKEILSDTAFDKLGRTISKIEDADNATGGAELQRKTEYQYNAQGSLMRIMHDPSADNTFADGVWTIAGGDTDQVTEYAYTNGQSSRWVTEIRYPTGDGTVGSSQSDKIVFTYNQDGTLSTRTDQNGTVLTWAYDTLRRKTEEEVTTLGTYTGGAAAVDSAIRAFTWTYDTDGHVQYLTAHTDTTPDTSTWTDAANQIKYTYNAAGRLIKEEQEYDGAVDGSTPAVEYGYGTDYASDYYNRLNYVEYPNNRKIWNGYTHYTGSLLQATINAKFNRVGQICKDNSGSLGDILGEYDFCGAGRVVKRRHDGTGVTRAGNWTRTDLWHGTSGWYKGLDRFGRIVDLTFGAADPAVDGHNFAQLKYTYDRNGNRLSIEDTMHKAESQSFTYDNLNRLTDAKRGFLSSGSVTLSDVAENYGMDLLGNFTSGAGGIKVNNSGTSTITHAVNATNEITTLDRPNPSGNAVQIEDEFASALGSVWSQTSGTWSVASGKANVDTLTSGSALLLASPEFELANIQVEVTFPTGSSTNKAGVIFDYPGATYYGVLLDRNAGKLAIHNGTTSSWGAALASTSMTINDSTAYVITIERKQKKITARVGTTSVSYETSAVTLNEQIGLYTDKTNVTFDNFRVYQASARDPKANRLVALAQTSLSSSTALVESESQHGGEAIIENFADDYYMLQVDVDLNSGTSAEIWGKYQDTNTGTLLRLTSSTWSLKGIGSGGTVILGSGGHAGGTPIPVRMKFNASAPLLEVYINGSSVYAAAGSSSAYGGVAFGGDKPKFDNLKVGYDNNGDDDIDDAGDDVIINETFTSTSVTPGYDHAGNLIDDGNFQYVYDAWNRLVKVRSDGDTDVTFQSAEFFADGRRARKDVSNSGEYDTAEVYLYDGQKIIETRDGSNNVKKQFVHGTQYNDELLMIRVYEKGDFYVHQDANWNVIMLTDLRSNTGGKVAERYVYTPYGEVNVMQETSFGDRDGDEDVDSTDKGTVGVTCTGTVTGECRILDLDFDGDYDSTDATLFDSLPSGIARHPGKFASGLDQPFMHQGLLLEPELRQIQNRLRQYSCNKRRFLQVDPIHYQDGLNHFAYLASNPTRYLDPSGTRANPWRALVAALTVVVEVPFALLETGIGLIVNLGQAPIIDGMANYGHYCGPNNTCGGQLSNGNCKIGPPYPGCHSPSDGPNGLDACCMVHDACYLGRIAPGSRFFTCDPSDNITYHATVNDPEQRACDEEICECMNTVSAIPFSFKWHQIQQMRIVFFCYYE